LGHQDELFELIENESNKDLISKEIETDLYSEEAEHTASLPPHVAEEIIRNILKSDTAVNQLITKRANKIQLYKTFAIAAAFIGVICLSLFTYNYFQNLPSKFAEIIPQNIEYTINKSKSTKEVLLSDGSKVYLEPGSVLHFDKSFKGDNREVYLEGEAFFKIHRNPSKPFLVYYNNIVTKVLGTSFRIGTNKSTGQIVVEVKTGHVQVSENLKLTKSENTITPVIITPNQKAIYDKSIRRFETTIVSHPIQVVPNEEATLIEPIILLFDQQKLNTVFDQIGKVYQIDITVENSALYNCVFTGDITNLDLFSALKIISIATNSEYEVNGTKILIKGKGCN
jgi:hypothetical protein